MTAAFSAFLAWAFLAALEPVRAEKSPLSISFREDFNQDGRVSVADVVALLIASRDNPADPALDYNGDGSYGITDAVALLIGIAKGKLHPVDLGSAGWRVLGPGGGGSLFVPRVSPHDPNHVFLCCDMTGAYVTTDQGVSWRMFNLRTMVDDIEFDPLVPGTVYACNTGLYRSEDGGVRWRLIYPDPANVIAEHMAGDHAEQSFETADGMPDAEIDKVLVDPLNSGHIWIALHARWNGPARILVSHSRGADWQMLSEIPDDGAVAIFPGAWWGKPEEVTVITGNSGRLISEETGQAAALTMPDTGIVSAAGGRGDSGAVFYILTSLRQKGSVLAGGVYRSTDGGKSWAAVNKDLTKNWASTGEVPRYVFLATCETRPEVVYLSCDYYSVGSAYPPQCGIFKTTDSGESWKWSYQADWNAVLSKNSTESWYTFSYDPSWAGGPHELGVCPTNPDICYAADGHAYRTLDGGTHWEEVYSNNRPGGSYSSRGLDVTTCYGVHFDPLDSLHIFITYTDIGLFHSFNGGESWVHAIQGIPFDWMNTCYWLVFDPAVKDRIWSVWTDCHDLPRPKMFTSGKLASGGYLGGVAVSNNGGDFWVVSNSGIPSNTVCTHIVLDPTSPADSRTLYVCGFGRGIYKSTDGGKKWAEASNGLGHNRNAWRMVRVPDGTLFLLMARGLEEGNVVDGVLYRSDDAAANWKTVTLPQGVNAPNDLVFDPSDPKRMYLSTWPWTDRSVLPRKEYDGGLYRTEDQGVTWKLVFRQDAHVYAAAIDPANSSTVIINTFDSAAFRSDDRGDSWRRLKGYNFKWGHRPVFDPHHSGMLYLTTFGGSVFYGPAAGVPGAFEDIENLNENWRWSE